MYPWRSGLILLVALLGVSLVFSSLDRSVVITNFGSVSIGVRSIARRSEIRGVFVHCATWSSPPDWNLIAQTLQTYKIDAIFGEFLRGDLGGYYYSNVSTALRGFGNQLGEAIAAMHPRGIQVYVSMDVLLGEHSRETDVVDSSGNTIPWICPSKPAIRAWMKTLVEELVRSYDIDGFMFDYIRYDREGVCYCDDSKAAFQAYLNETISDWNLFKPGGSRYKEFMEWRTVPINELVRDMRNWMLAIKPPLKFTEAAFELYADAPTAWRYWIGQDTTNWIDNGYLDMVAPMMYDPNATLIETYINYSREYYNGGVEGKIPFLAFISTGVTAPFAPSDFKAVVDKVRSINADGWIIWTYGGPGCPYNFPDIRNYLSLVDLPDTFAVSNPQITVNPGRTQVTVKWTTELISTSKVEYSTNQLFTATKKHFIATDFDYWDMDHNTGTIVQDLVPTTQHEIAFPIVAYQTVYFRIQSQDSSGTATSEVMTITG